MNKTSFSASAALQFGWETFKKRIHFWVIATLLVLTLGDYSGGMSSWKSESSSRNPMQPPAMGRYEERFPITVPPVSDTDTPLFVPDGIDEVLGMHTPRDGSNFGAFMFFRGMALMAFFLPFIIMMVLLAAAIDMGVQKLFLAAARGKEVGYEIILSEIDLKKALRFIVAAVLYGLSIFLGLLFFILPGIYLALKYMFVTYAIVDRNVSVRDAFSLSSDFTRGNKFSLLLLALLLVLVNILGALALLYGLLVSIPVSMLAFAYAYDQLSKGTSRPARKKKVA